MFVRAKTAKRAIRDYERREQNLNRRERDIEQKMTEHIEKLDVLIKLQPRHSKAVLAFQQFWNNNHPKDKIAEDGLFGQETAARYRAAFSGSRSSNSGLAAILLHPDLINAQTKLP